jgi:hypothetical protein
MNKTGPRDEDGRERFERLRRARLTKFEESARMLANLSNTYRYDFDAASVRELEARIFEALETMFGRFDAGLKQKGE